MLVVDIDTTRMANDLEFLKELEILDYNLPAFAFLSATDIKTKAACYEYGADGVLPKPIDYEDFHLIIKSSKYPYQQIKKKIQKQQGF